MKFLLGLLGFKSRSNFKKVDWLAVDVKLRQFNQMSLSADQATKKQLLIQADNLVDQILKQSSTRGQTMGERLKALRSILPSKLYSRLWQAHIKRNELVHESDSFVADWEIQKHLQSFKEAIEYLRGR